MTKLLHAELTGAIIGTYYDVFNDLSRTYPQYIYEAAMMWSLQVEKGIPCVQQDEYEVWYKDRLVGKQRLDIFLAGEVAVVNKAAERIEKIHLAATSHPALMISAPFCPSVPFCPSASVCLSASFCQSALQSIP